MPRFKNMALQLFRVLQEGETGDYSLTFTYCSPFDLLFFFSSFPPNSDASFSVWQRLQRTTPSSLTRKASKVGLALWVFKVSVATGDQAAGEGCVIGAPRQHHVAAAGRVWAHFVIIDVRRGCRSLCWLSEWIHVITHPSPGWPSSVALETADYLLHNWCRYFTLVTGSECLARWET